MRPRLLDLIICPQCQRDLTLQNARHVDDPLDSEITQGALACPNGHRFAIVDGVPRLTNQIHPDAQTISASFSREWGHFQYNDRTWMQAVDQRCALFVREVRFDADQLRGKVVLDAGCGNATLSMGIMQRFGCEVLAADVSDSVVCAYKHFLPQGTGQTHFAQTDLTHPPFRPSSFDLIYSSGVLHHNRSTLQALQALLPALKPGGTIYIWLYARRPGLVHKLKQALRSVIAPMPAAVKYAIVWAWLPQSMVRQWFRYHLRGRRPEDRLKWRERMVLLLDHYTPRYRWEHTPEEVHQWYKDLGFQEIETTEVRDWGFGVAARKPGESVTKPAKELTSVA